MNHYKNITIGSDVEVFLQNRRTQEIVSAEGLIPGHKYNPHVYDLANRFFAIHPDNVSAEYAIPPVTDKKAFYEYLMKGLNYIDSIIPKELCTAIIPAAHLNEKWLQTTHAQTFGCDKSYDPYTRNVLSVEHTPGLTLRSCGLHVHVGFEGASDFHPEKYEFDDERTNLIKSMDLHLGVPSVIMEPDNERKQLYGKAGEMRPKEYGVEYRTLSNFFLSSKKLIEWVYESTQKAINWLNNGNKVDENLGFYIRDVVNNKNQNEANYLIKEFKLDVV